MKKYAISGIITIIFMALANYICLPAWNLKSGEFWLFIICGLFVFAGLAGFIETAVEEEDFSAPTIVFIIIFLVTIILGVVLACASSRVFNAYRYQKMMSVEETEFSADMEEENITNIALMDTASAQIYGNRTLGDLADVVSQYKVSETYSQIAINSIPMKVAPLEHSGLFKAFNNAEIGIPGYVKVNPVTNVAEFVRLENSIVYSPSALFSRDLKRHIRRDFTTSILGETFFEVDEEGNPYWITQVIDHTIGLFGGKIVKGVIITDVHTGLNEFYAVGNVPEWVDIVYDGDYICEKFDDFGKLANGWWNSIVGQKGCKVTTDDYGYKVIGNDVYIYTGVTSVVSDESNIGFILVNSRTMEAKYYPVVGAEEYSAMGAAEGEVQQYGYKASFPSLVNVAGEATYIMVLKDDNGLVKKIAMVNVEHYDVVAVADTQAQVASAYKKLLTSRNVIKKDVVADDAKSVKTVINEIDYIVMDGVTTVYIKTDNGVFKKEFEESLMLLNASDEVTVTYFVTGADIEYIENITK